ncbi:MAG TPA: slipin family protein [Bryobacteraceae bacterium]|nr:slipin family protein [Bryobacteraceae bacterium]
MLRRVLIGDNERILVIRKRRFAEILEPGERWMFALGGEMELQRYNVRDLVYSGEWADYIANSQPELAARYFTIVETSDAQVAIVYLDGRLARVIGPANRVLFWKGPVNVTYERIDVRANADVPEQLLPSLGRLGRESLVTFAAVEEGKRGLMYLDGRLIRELEPGNYGFWNAVATPRIEVLEMRRQTVEVSGQEILTSDKVTLRVNISAVYEIVNVTNARVGVKDVGEYLYRALQIAARQSLGKRTLEQVLAEKTDIDEAVSAEVRREMEAYGVRVSAIALKDIILPGDIRDILNQVVTAEKQAQANLIRRREETAATRSLLNTAKLMEENPLLVRLKELESLEKIADKVEKITVVGGLNALLERTVTLRAE